MGATETLSTTVDIVTVWQCIGCGRIEAPQPGIGVCQDPAGALRRRSRS